MHSIPLPRSTAPRTGNSLLPNDKHSYRASHIRSQHFGPHLPLIRPPVLPKAVSPPPESGHRTRDTRSGSGMHSAAFPPPSPPLQPAAQFSSVAPASSSPPVAIQVADTACHL